MKDLSINNIIKLLKKLDKDLKKNKEKYNIEYYYHFFPYGEDDNINYHIDVRTTEEKYDYITVLIPIKKEDKLL